MLHSIMFHYCTWNRIEASQQDGTLAEIVTPKNSSTLRYYNLIVIYFVTLTLRSGSIFPNANNLAVHDGTFYAAHNLVVKKFQGEKLS